MTKSQVPHTAIIGATSGIGELLAKRFAADGNVSVFGRRAQRLENLKLSNSNIFTGNMDVSDVNQIHAGIAGCVEHFGKLHRLIYCSGQQVIKPYRFTTPDEIDSMYKVNLRGAMYSAQYFCNNSFSEKNAVMCFISSIAAKRPEPALVCYSVMKAGMDTLIKGLAKECSPRRFNGVAPGWLDTEMTRNQSIYDENFTRAIEKRSPLGLVNIESVLNAVEFLTSQKAESITGQVIVVDSGFSL